MSALVMEPISAANPEELLARLQDPTLARWARSWIDLGLIEFPVELVQGERPDVRLEMPTGPVGIVLVEAAPEPRVNEWAFTLNEAIRAQTAELNRPGFAAGRRNWLCADTGSPGPGLKVPHASRLLELPTLIHGKHRFDLVLLLVGHQAVLLNGGTVKVHDL